MNHSDSDDATLVRHCLDGDAAAWRAVVQRNQRLVYAIALRCGLDEAAAADVFQTVFERLFENLYRLAQPERLRAWIVTTARREALRQMQRARRETATSPDVLVELSDNSASETTAEEALPDAVLEELQRSDHLRRALDRLDPRCRSLLTALFLDDDNDSGYAEIARRLGLPVGSLGPTRARCLDKLRRIMNET